jgi:hypothetical protein
VLFTSTTPDTTSPVQSLKKLNAKASEDLTVALPDCAFSDASGIEVASISGIKIKRRLGKLPPIQIRGVRDLLPSADAAAVDMADSPFGEL